MVTAPLTTDQERSHGASWHNDTRKEQSRCYGYVEHDHLKALTKANRAQRPMRGSRSRRPRDKGVWRGWSTLAAAAL